MSDNIHAWFADGPMKDEGQVLPKGMTRLKVAEKPRTPLVPFVRGDKEIPIQPREGLYEWDGVTMRGACAVFRWKGWV